MGSIGRNVYTERIVGLRDAGEGVKYLDLAGNVLVDNGSLIVDQGIDFTSFVVQDRIDRTILASPQTITANVVTDASLFLVSKPNANANGLTIDWGDSWDADFYDNYVTIVGKTNGFGLDLTANGHTFTIDGQALPYSVGANETLVLHCNENDDFTIVAKTPNA